MRNLGWIITLAVGAVVTLMLSGFGEDAPFRIQMGILTAVLGLAAVVLLLLLRCATFYSGRFLKQRNQSWHS